MANNFSRKSVAVTPKPEAPSKSSEPDTSQKIQSKVKKLRKKSKSRIKKKVQATTPVSKPRVGKPEAYSSSGGGGQVEDHKKSVPLKLRPENKSKLTGGAGMF